MHPHKKEAAAAHASKMSRMGVAAPKDGHATGDGYGLSKEAPVYRDGRFGGDKIMDSESKLGPAPLNPRAFKHGGAVKGENAHHHLGKPGRKKYAAGGREDGSDLKVEGQHPYKRGGHVHSDEKEDKALIKREFEKHDKAEEREDAKFASGGAVGSKKKGGKTVVNVIVAPQGQGQGGPTPVPVPVPAGPPPMAMPPPRPPVAVAPPGLAPAGMPVGGPPMMPGRKRGGSVLTGPENNGKMVPMEAGALSGEGRLAKIAIQRRGVNAK